MRIGYFRSAGRWNPDRGSAAAQLRAWAESTYGAFAQCWAAATGLVGETAIEPIATDLEIVRQRYRHIARVYPILELLWLPPGIRRAVDSLTLRLGHHVIELGCGTGRNLLMLSEAVGSGGRVVGVDLSPEMLDRACRRARGLRLQNVSLYLADAATFRSPEPVDAVLFSLSYSVMPNRVEALRLAWEQLRSGGRLVVMDGKIPDGLIGKVSRSLITWLSQRTVLGDPNSRPWESLGDLGADVEIRDRLAGFYFICRSVKRTGQFHIDAALKSCVPSRRESAACRWAS